MVEIRRAGGVLTQLQDIRHAAVLFRIIAGMELPWQRCEVNDRACVVHIQQQPKELTMVRAIEIARRQFAEHRIDRRRLDQDATEKRALGL